MKIDFKSEKGSATIYVLSTMLVLIMLMTFVLISTTNKQIAGLDVSEGIKSTYEKDINNVDVIYNALVSGE